MIFKKNDIVDISVTGVTAQGAGIGKIDGFAVFIPLTAPGDRARVRLVKVTKSYAYGKLEQLLSPSPLRQEPDCPVFAQCGGCCYRHITYEAELEIKTQRVKDSLERIGGLSHVSLEPIIGAGSRNGYRNKALIPLGLGKDSSLQMGFYAVNSHRIVNCENCLLQPEIFSTAVEAFKKWFYEYGDSVYDEAAHKGVLRRLYLRLGEKSGELMVCLVINGDKLKYEKELIDILKSSVPGLSSVVINKNTDKTNVALGEHCRTVFGSDTVRDELCGLSFQLSPLSFYQVNRAQAQRLYEKAAQYAGLSGNEVLLDLYCGTGTIGLSMAKNAESLIGVEIVPQAVENARENARANGINNARFICGDASEAARLLSREGTKPHVVILDPPRKGCDEALIRTVAKDFSPLRIVYVSCDPATLARDLKLFGELGYSANSLTPVDMFPGTAHVESVVLLKRSDSGDINS